MRRTRRSGQAEQRQERDHAQYSCHEVEDDRADLVEKQQVRQRCPRSQQNAQIDQALRRIAAGKIAAVDECPNHRPYGRNGAQLPDEVLIELQVIDHMVEQGRPKARGEVPKSQEAGNDPQCPRLERGHEPAGGGVQSR